MDLNVVRSVVTVVLFLLFILLCIYVCSPRRRAEFEAAARLPFDDSEPTASESQQERP